MIESSNSSISYVEEGPGKGHSISSTTSNNFPSDSKSGASTFSLANSETRLVLRSKLIVYLVIAVAAAALGAATYFFIRNGETAEFEATVSGT